MHSPDDKRWMRECFRLAAKGKGFVSPNPLVGAVVVLGGKNIGSGFHEKYGAPHAEVVAIRRALRKRRDLGGATLYVNLEPCAHFGKTPPCTDAIIASGIGRVVAGMTDPNPQVSGKGFKQLRSSGLEVVTGVLGKESRQLNDKFVKYISSGIPFVALKAATTGDGYVAKPDGSSRWITNARSRRIVHELRSEYDAVAVGAGTVLADDPLLTVRHVKGRDPVRVVIDGRLRVGLTARVFDTRRGGRSILYTDRANDRRARPFRKLGVEVVLMESVNGRIPVRSILADLGARGIASLLVEGGPIAYRSFLEANAVDKVYLFVSPKRFGAGIAAFGPDAPRFELRRRRDVRLDGDTLFEGTVSFRRRR
ncbi:MAG TPA: bifunctional diaminohydroxyphosphoribosylaminopyrimidine deaminase/5-amino-6-(5-phosphoribosylamino)uracil reductase RibD [Bacteroidota bacterium]|nr:bifunctional diaminohydroxyphosphoribosylaminopyrimidine deaminase/5-amino-6-(5-phosphoribosylamino)uracil reductase RibD [Bacteroidota bacterium]